MKAERKQYKCTLTPLTPIQIGNGNQIYPYDYVIKNGIYYRIDVAELIEKFPDNKKIEFIKLLELGNMIKIRTFILDNYKEEYGYIYKCPVEKSLNIEYEDKIRGALKRNEQNQFIIEEFIGNFNGKYIPGSTIKGAMRSAYLFNEFDKNRDRYIIKRKEKNNFGKKIDTKPFILVDKFGKEANKTIAKREVDKREATMLGLTRLEPKFDPFKNFTVSDTEIQKDFICIKSVKRAKKNQPVPMNNFEILKSLYADNVEIKFQFNIITKNFVENTLKNASFDKRTNEKIIEEEKDIYLDILFQSLNEKSKMILEKDKKFFKEINHQIGEKVCDKLLSELKRIEENNIENEALIRFGRGSGFDNTTFNLVNTNEEVYTRVIAGDCPVGWALITFEEV